MAKSAEIQTSTENLIKKVRSRWDGQRTPIDLGKQPSRAKQSMKAECDINNIVSRYNKTGQLPALIKTNPTYGDYSEPLDFQKSYNTIIKAQEQFEALPARLRERFANDPKNFLDFCSRPENIGEMETLGLLNERALERLQQQREAVKVKKGEGAPPAKPDSKA